MGVSSGSGEVGPGFATGAELERMLEKDMTPAARLGIWARHKLAGWPRMRSGVEERTLAATGRALEWGTGDSVLARADMPVEDAPFAIGLGMGGCLIVGEAILGGRDKGLADSAAGAG